MKTLIVGANGKVGTMLSGKMWAAHDFSPVALIRDPRQQTKVYRSGCAFRGWRSGSRHC